MTEEITITNEGSVVTKDDLNAFRENLLKELDDRFNAFVDDFLDAMAEGQESCESCKEEEVPLTENPARYILFSGGQKYFATEVKPNSFAGVDFFLHEVDAKTGKEYNSQGTITSADVVIVDLQPEMTLETFSAIKRSTIDYVVQKAQEARAKEEAEKNIPAVPKDVSVMNSYG